MIGQYLIRQGKEFVDSPLHRNAGFDFDIELNSPPLSPPIELASDSFLRELY